MVGYPITSFQVQIDTSIYMNHCVLNAVVIVPTGDMLVGLFGSIHCKGLNDWMLGDGTKVHALLYQKLVHYRCIQINVHIIAWV